LLLLLATYSLPVDPEKVQPPPDPCSRVPLHRYIAAAVLMWVLTSTLPGIGFFRFAWTEEVTAYARYDQAYQEGLRTVRRHALEDAYRRVKIDAREPFGKKWESRFDDADKIRQYHLFPRPGSSRGNDWLYSGIQRFMQRYKPIYNEVSAAFRYQDTQYSIADPAGLDFHIGPVTVAGLLLVLTLIVLWARHAAVHIFFGRIKQTLKGPPASQGLGQDEEFRRKWLFLSEEERLTLVQLVEESLVNPKQAQTVAKLVHDGLLVRSPHLRPATDGFAAFIRSRIERSKITEWERSDPGFRWGEIRWAIGIVLLAVAAVIFLTQRGLFDTIIAFITAIAVVVPRLLGIVNSLGSTASRS
jgi:hypothetical protein